MLASTSAGGISLRGFPTVLPSDWRPLRRLVIEDALAECVVPLPCVGEGGHRHHFPAVGHLPSKSYASHRQALGTERHNDQKTAADNRKPGCQFLDQSCTA